MAKRVLILLSDPAASRGLARTLETLGVKSICHKNVFEAISEVYSSQLGWIVLGLDLFDKNSRAQLLTPELWASNRQTPVVLVSNEDPNAVKRFFAGGPMRLGGILPLENAERLADRAFTLYLESVGQDTGGKAAGTFGETRSGHQAPEPKPAGRATEKPGSRDDAPVRTRPPSKEPVMEEPPVAVGAGSNGLSIEEKRRIEAKLQLLDEGDWYRLLEIQANATDRQVKSAYFRLVKQFHPDRYFGRLDEDWNKHVTRLFRGITRIYEHALDPKERQRYDNAYRPSEPAAVTETPVRVEVVSSAKQEAELDQTPLSKDELEEFLKREKEWMQQRDSQASTRAQALFDQASDVLQHPAPHTLPLAPIREAYRVVSEASSMVPENDEYAIAHETLRRLYESKRAYYHFRRGQDRLASGDLSAGYQDLKDAILFNPKTEYVLLLVQTMLHHGWDLHRAQILSQSLVDEEPENPAYRLMYGRLLAMQGALKDGLAHLHLAARLGSKNEAFQWIQHFERHAH